MVTERSRGSGIGDEQRQWSTLGVAVVVEDRGPGTGGGKVIQVRSSGTRKKWS